MRTPILTEEELRDLVSRDEGQFLEFKSVRDRSGPTPKQIRRRAVRDTIAESAAAFANSDGGLLLIGVEDDGTPTGCDYPDDVIDEFVGREFGHSSPPGNREVYNVGRQDRGAR